jgi:hypothetical protein
LRPVLALKDGRRIGTLADAPSLFLALPERHRANAHWRYATELLLEAAHCQKPAIDEVDAQTVARPQGRGVDLASQRLSAFRLSPLKRG